MAKFIECSVLEIESPKKYKNYPVNIDLVEQVILSTNRPSNSGMESTSAIIFKGIDCQWIYDEFHEDEMYADYKKIVKNKF